MCRCHFSLAELLNFTLFFLLRLVLRITNQPFPDLSEAMAWRNQGITGSNNIPLGRRRFGGDDEDDSRTTTPSSVPDGPKRGRSPVRGMSSLKRVLFRYDI